MKMDTRAGMPRSLVPLDLTSLPGGVDWRTRVQGEPHRRRAEVALAYGEASEIALIS